MSRSDIGRSAPASMMMSTFVAESAPRVTRRRRSEYPASLSVASAFVNVPNGKPASTKAPRHMSPLIPEKQSKYAIFISHSRGRLPAARR